MEYQNIKTVFQNAMFQIAGVFVIKKFKNTVLWTLFYVISDLKGEEIVGTFNEKELQKIVQKEFRVEKGKATIVLLIVGLIEKDLV